MKYPLETSGPTVRCLRAVLVGLAFWLTSASAENQPASKRAEARPNPAPQEVPVPKSVFVVPTQRGEGTDPFFPKSTGMPAPTPKVSTTSVFSELVLKGFSGTTQQRLAIINNHTFAAGEETDLHIGSGRVHVRCLEVRTDSVVIEIDGERREMRLRQSF
jgi:hypothetical protein